MLIPSLFLNSLHTQVIKLLSVVFGSAVRWNAIMAVLRGQEKDLELGGHISTYQSAASMYEVCFNHFFKAATDKNGGDLVSSKATRHQVCMLVHSLKVVLLKIK